MIKICMFFKNILTNPITALIFETNIEQHMYNTIKNRTTSLISASPYSSNRIVVLDSIDIISLDIILGLSIIISILGIILG
jgi:hypothetical protein